MKYQKFAIKLFKIIFGIAFTIFMFITFLLLILNVSDSSAEGKGYFSLIVLADTFLGLVFYILWKLDNRFFRADNFTK